MSRQFPVFTVLPNLRKQISPICLLSILKLVQPEHGFSFIVVTLYFKNYKGVQYRRFKFEFAFNGKSTIHCRVFSHKTLVQTRGKSHGGYIGWRAIDRDQKSSHKLYLLIRVVCKGLEPAWQVCLW
jgi:hypothetical protein